MRPLLVFTLALTWMFVLGVAILGLHTGADSSYPRTTHVTPTSPAVRFADINGGAQGDGVQWHWVFVGGQVRRIECYPGTDRFGLSASQTLRSAGEGPAAPEPDAGNSMPERGPYGW